MGQRPLHKLLPLHKLSFRDARTDIKGQGPGLVNVLCGERKTNKFLTLGARKTTPTIFAYTNQRIGDEHTDAAAFDADAAAVGACDRRVPAERREGGHRFGRAERADTEAGKLARQTRQRTA